MKYNKFGRTDLKISQICLGTMTWGGQNSEAEAHEQMDYAISHGINFFDTAEMYAFPASAESCGKTEEIIGSWFNSRKNRDKIILATKIAGPGLAWIRGGNYKIDRDNILQAVEGSLKRLQTDYIDLYQLHWPNRGSYHFGRLWDYNPAHNDKDNVLSDFHETLQTLDELIKAGKIRHVGLSNESAWGTMEYLRLAKEHNLPHMVSIQNEYSLLNRMFEPDLAEISLMENIGLLAWSPLAAGALSGKYLDNNMPDGSRRTLLDGPSHRDTPQANAAIRAYIEIAEKHNLDICQMALAFVNERPFVTSNIIGATSMEQLKTNIDSVTLTLSDEIYEDINKVRKQYPIPF